MNGTSMATPHVAGVAALWWQAVQAQLATPRSVNVAAKLLATARGDTFVPNCDISDRGAGIVTAP
jgi:subtilisin family serine protease